MLRGFCCCQPGKTEAAAAAKQFPAPTPIAPRRRKPGQVRFTPIWNALSHSDVALFLLLSACNSSRSSRKVILCAPMSIASRRQESAAPPRSRMSEPHRCRAVSVTAGLAPAAAKQSNYLPRRACPAHARKDASHAALSAGPLERLTTRQESVKLGSSLPGGYPTHVSIHHWRARQSAQN